MSTNTESYSYRPGEVYTSITQICGNKATGQVADVTWPATFVAGVMYGVIFFFLSFVLTYFINKSLNKRGVSFSNYSETKYSPQYTPVKNQREAEDLIRRFQQRADIDTTSSSSSETIKEEGNNTKKRLEELRDLHASGLIDTEEYERKKEEILKGL